MAQKKLTTKNTIVFDLETRTNIPRSSNQRQHIKAVEALEISVLCCYHYDKKKYFFFTNKNIGDFITLTKSAKNVVGFNTLLFDYIVLKKHGLHKDIKKKTVDIFDHVKRKSGKWISLDALSKENLGRGKIYKGADSPKLNSKTLYSYCKSDVTLTRDLYNLFIDGRLKFEELAARRKFGKPRRHDPLDEYRINYSPIEECPRCGSHGFYKLDELIDAELMTEGQFADYMAGHRGTLKCVKCKLEINYP